MNTEFMIMTARAKKPSTAGGNYRRIALVEVEEGVIPKMISERAIGMVRIIQVWEKLHVGGTERCAYQRAMKEARERLAMLTLR